ncbi:Cna B-type domain-containing protein [Virgibacillus kimchii]
MNKRLSILFIFMLVFQTISSSLFLPSQSVAEGSEESVFTGVSFTDEDGKAINIDDLDGGLAVNVHVDWSVSHVEIEEGDTASLSLSDKLYVEEEQHGALTDGEVEVGTYQAALDGAVTVRFDEAIMESPEALGTIVVEAVVDEQQVKQPEEEDSEDVAKEDDDPKQKEASDEQTLNSEEVVEADDSLKDRITTFDASEVDPSQVNDLGNIFTFKSLIHNGEEIEDGNIIEIEEGTEVEIEFTWDTKELGAQSGDTASMQLPNTFEQVTTPEADIVTSGIKVGTYSIEDGELIFVFNDRIEDGDVYNGEVGLNLDFNLEKFEENIEQVIEFNDRDETTLNVIARPSGDISAITKEGHPDRGLNAREITWSIDVMNHNEELISEGILEDIVPEGLGEPRDFDIHELSVGISGDKRVGDEAGFGAQVDGNAFTINFPEIAPFNGYRVEYTTIIEDYTIDSFTNDALFSYGDTELPAKATVDALERSNPIEKDGEYNGNTHQIDWTITVNESGGEIDKAIVYDSLPAEQSIVEDSIEVYRYDSNWENRESVSIDSDDFPINLGEVDAEEIYQIEFSTDIDWRLVNDGEYQHHNQFTNETELRDGDITVGEDRAIVDHWRATLLEKSGVSNVDYDNKTLTWTIEVNNAKHPLDDVVVNDAIPEGLTISEDDISVTGEDGETYEGVDISVDGQSVQISLENIGTETITIEYRTTITDFTIDEFDNKATLDGDGLGVGEPRAEDDETIRPPANSFAKDFEGIDYNERTMDWRLTVNPIREAITELTIVDTFPNKGMILLPDTVEITVGGEEVTEGFTVTSNEEDGETGYHKGFTIEFDNEELPLNAQMEITYQTSYDPQREIEGHTLDPHVGGEDQVRVYENHAQFTGETEYENEFDTGRDANTRVREDSWNSGYKEGQLVHEGGDVSLVDGWKSGEERKIAWQLYTNYQEQDLGTGVVIEDTLDYEGTIDVGSVVVSVYEVDADGNTTVTDEVLDEENYDVNYDGKSFTLTFDDGFTVDERYVVQFTTTVPNISQPNYVNNATVIVGDDEYPYEGTVNYNNHDQFLDKSTGHEGSDVYIGDELNWEIQVNESLSIIPNPVITDTISAGMEYIEGTLEISTASGNELVEGEDFSLSNEKNENDETVLTITLTNTLSEKVNLNYTTVVTAEDGDTVSNEVNLDGEYIEVESITSEELTAEQFSWVDGEFNENRGALKITKLDYESGDPIENNPATFELYYELNGVQVLFADEIKTDKNGQIEIGNLPLRTYYLQEVDAPTGYIIDEEEQVIEVTQAYGTEEHVYEAEFTNTIEKTDISVTKVWADANDQDGQRPGDIEVQLFADDEEVGDPVTLSEGNTWRYTWEELNAYHSNGETIEYTVEEVDVPEGYTSTNEVGDDGEITITNSYTPETTDIAVNKNWEDADDQDGVRPNNVTVNLLADGEIKHQTVLNEDNDWQYTFTELPVYQDGHEITYTVTEDTVPNYSTIVEEAGTGEDPVYTITNSYTPDETSVTVTKSWEDDNNRDGNRPTEIEVQLIANGEPYGESVTIDQSNWSNTWSDLPVNEDGEPITYTVEEVEVPEGYKVRVNNNNHGNIIITNSYEPEITEIAVSKEWDDENDQDGIRPNNVTVNLLGNGEIVRRTVLDDENDWRHTFSNLPVYENGEEITYRVTENNVPNYTDSIDQDPENENGFVITNSYTPEETSVTVTKSWQDGNNQDNNRPDSITVQLIRNGTAIGDPVEIDASDNWTHQWTELDLNEDGEAINYTVEETNVPEGYTVRVNDNDHGNIIITNNYTPELTDIPVKKVWDDDEDRDRVRPNNVMVILLADGSIVGGTILNEARNWEHTFTNLPVYENGEEINYSVTENIVPHYSTSIEENENGFVLTNSYTPDETTVTVTKGWEDENNQDGIRPDIIEVQLLANGDATEDPVEVLAEEDWTYTWEGLPLNAEGEPITYSVKEINVPEGYEQDINDENHENIIITNSYTPETIGVSGTKTWDDADNQDGNRPENITVNLLANGTQIDSTDVTEADEWEYSFTNLPKFEAGEEITYTVTENTVEDYTQTINGFNITNQYTPGETAVTVTKHWDDANNQDGIRPETIEVQLTADGEHQGDPVELTEENNWTHTWTELDEKAAGEAIIYSVVELTDLPEYETTINDENHGNIIITNSYTPEEIEISGTKTWDDADNQHNTRPESITVNVLANGEVVQSIEVTEADDWAYTFANLPRYEAGEEIVYSISEDEVEGYESTVEGYDITNTLIPEEETTTPGTTDKPADSGKEVSTTGDEAGTGDRMPDTATNMYNMILIGVALLAIGITLTLIYRKRKAI